MDFTNKVAVVTGGASGIGRACCVSLAKKGARVAVLDRNLAGAQAAVEEIISQGGVACALELNVQSVENIKEVVALVSEKYSKIDILINCAGIAQAKKIEELTEAEWDRMMEINLKGSFFMSQTVINEMKKNNGGRIVNLGSLAGEIGGIAVGANYAASKGAIITLTKSLAKAVAAYGINVNTVSPGFIATDMTRDLNQDVRLVPLGRKGTAEEVANVILFLCSDYSTYLTGVNIDVNGGLHMG